VKGKKWQRSAVLAPFLFPMGFGLRLRPRVD
jgi:hypothetical protein